jgi:hypothetical protein
MVQKNNQIIAVASGMQIINSFGSSVGQVRAPSEFTGDKVSYMASSIHEPPFLFPGLFMKFSAIDTTAIPSSRYITDWWLSLNLVAQGQIFTTHEISIDYRVHDGQESAVAPSRRKYFEAQVVLSRFIESEIFENFLRSLSDFEKIDFLNWLFANGPVYGDREFGSSLMLNLLLKTVDSMGDATESSRLLGTYAAHNGVFLREGEVRAFISKETPLSSDLPANFKLAAVEGSCGVLLRLLEADAGLDVLGPTFLVGCSHSRVSTRHTFNCGSAPQTFEHELEILISRITVDLERDGSFEFKLTPRERRLILNFRFAKGHLPKNLLSNLWQIFDRSGK